MAEAVAKPDFNATWAATCRAVQTRICDQLATADGSAEFSTEPWQKEPGEMLQGGGVMRQIRGEVFEKGGVNFSEVYGTFSPAFQREIPGALESDGKFWACGVSLVIHPRSPKVPIVHFNMRRIETSKAWFGGGADLTPAIEYAEDTAAFHEALKQACEPHHTGAYADYKAACDDYFYIKHWQEPRGVGGVFIDDLASGDDAADAAMLERVADNFTAAYCAIVNQRKTEKWNAADKETQLRKRAKYVEFNLLYDRGTRFGFQSGGNPAAILMSMPPEAKW